MKQGYETKTKYPSNARIEATSANSLLRDWGKEAIEEGFQRRNEISAVGL